MFSTNKAFFIKNYFYNVSIFYKKNIRLSPKSSCYKNNLVIGNTKPFCLMQAKNLGK